MRQAFDDPRVVDGLAVPGALTGGGVEVEVGVRGVDRRPAERRVDDARRFGFEAPTAMEEERFAVA